MLNLGRHGDVSDWYSAEFSRFCAASHPFYVKAAAWSPDASAVSVAATGFHPENWRRTFPLTGLCDAVAAFPATRRSGLPHRWVNYTGCDSLSSAAADSGAVYAGGHERWGDNPRGCNAAGPGAIASPGMGGYAPGLSGGRLLTGPPARACTPVAAAWARTTCWSPAPGCGSQATISTAPTGAVASPAMPGSASCPTAPSSAARRVRRAASASAISRAVDSRGAFPALSRSQRRWSGGAGWMRVRSEVVPLAEIVDEAGLGRLPAQ